MGQVLKFKTNYQPASKFNSKIVREIGEYLHKNLSSFMDELNHTGVKEHDLQELFVQAMKEVFVLRQIEKTPKAPTTKYQVGQLIFNRGDMANSEGWFKIVDVNENKMYDMEEVGGEGRTIKRIYESVISEVDKQNGSTRFVTESAYKAAREAAANRINEAAARHREKAVSITVNGTETTFTNVYCWVSYDSESKRFSGRDLTDRNNEPAFYSQNTRSHKKAGEALKNEFNSETTMYQAMSIIQTNGIKCRSYCAMD